MGVVIAVIGFVRFASLRFPPETKNMGATYELFGNI
jgi:hypothetical protein